MCFLLNVMADDVIRSMLREIIIFRFQEDVSFTLTHLQENATSSRRKLYSQVMFV